MITKIPLGLSEALIQPDKKPHYFFSKILKKHFSVIPVQQNDQDQQIIAENNQEINDLCGLILADTNNPKAYLPSVFDSHSQSIRNSTLQTMRQFPLLPIEDADRLLANSAIRDNFFQRVYVVWRWKNLAKSGIDAQSLLAFHARHKFTIMCYADYRDLGHLLAKLDTSNLQSIADEYIAQLMLILIGVVKRSHHVNVLQHIQGHLKKNLSIGDKSELSSLIERYRQGDVPLHAPIALLNHFFQLYPDSYIQESYYLSQYPFELLMADDVSLD